MGSISWWGKPPEDPYSPCPCGSGKKYKFCCRDKDREQPVTPAAAWPLGDGDTVSTPVGGMTLTEDDFARCMRLDQEGQRLMVRGDYVAAIQKYKAAIKAFPPLPVPHNNLAFCEYLQGNLGGAIARAEQTLRELDPDNVYTVALLVHLRLIRGPRAEAERLGKRLLTMRPGDESAAVKRVEALARLDWHAEVLAACAKIPPGTDPDLDYYAGVAAANLGRGDEALRHLRRAQAGASCRTSVKRFLVLLERKRGPDTLRGHWPYFLPPDVACAPVMERLAHMLDKKQEKAENLPGLLLYAVAMLDADGWEPGVEFLRRIGSEEAVTLLREIVEGVCGPDEARMQALRALQQLEKAPIKARMWFKGEWREIGAQCHEIVGEPTRPIPPQLASRIEQAHRIMHRQRWTEAERCWREIVAADPNYLPTFNNLAGCLIEQGRMDEAKAVLEEVLRREPQYNFALMTLAGMKLDSDPVAAKTLMNQVNLPRKVHISEMISWLLLQARMALHDGEYESAQGSWQQAKDLMPKHAGVLALAEVFEDEVTAPGILARFLERMKGRERHKREQARRRLLSDAFRLEEAYGDFRKDELVELAKRLELAKPYQLGKDELLARVCGMMRNAGTVERLLAGLEDTARAALQALLAAEDGAIEFAEFTRAYEKEEHNELACDILRRDGLAVTGMWRGRCVVMVPPELQAILRAGGHLTH